MIVIQTCSKSYYCIVVHNPKLESFCYILSPRPIFVFGVIVRLTVFCFHVSSRRSFYEPRLPAPIRGCIRLPDRTSSLWPSVIRTITRTTTANTGGSPAGGWVAQWCRVKAPWLVKMERYANAVKNNTLIWFNWFIGNKYKHRGFFCMGFRPHYQRLFIGRSRDAVFL